METDDLYHTPKKGMTIFKAFLLVFLAVFGVLILGLVAGVFKAYQEEASDIHIYFNAFSFLISLSAFIIIGFWINLKDLPYFNKVGLVHYFKIVALGIIWVFLSSLIDDILRITNIGNLDINIDLNDNLELVGFWPYLVVILYVVFSIGVLGHGLLRNYPLSKIILIVGFFSFPFLIPSWVVSSFLMSVILIYCYYHTQAFQLCLVFVLTKVLLEIGFSIKYGSAKILKENVFKDELVGNPSMYYILLAAALFIFGMLLFSFRKIEKKHIWLR